MRERSRRLRWGLLPGVVVFGPQQRRVKVDALRVAEVQEIREELDHQAGRLVGVLVKGLLEHLTDVVNAVAHRREARAVQARRFRLAASLVHVLPLDCGRVAHEAALSRDRGGFREPGQLSPR